MKVKVAGLLDNALKLFSIYIDDGFIGTPGALSIVSCHLTAIGGLVEREIK